MHAYRKLIEEQMEAGEMTQSDLARASGVTRQRINQILKSDRDRLVHVPDTATVEGFAKAFKLAPEVVWIAVAEAMGLPRFVVPSITHQVKDVTNAQLLSELASRMDLEVSVRPSQPATGEGKKSPDDGEGGTVTELTPKKQAPPDLVKRAARKGKSQGRALRKELDKLGEESQIDPNDDGTGA